MKRILLIGFTVLMSVCGYSQATYYDTTFSNGAQNCTAKVWLPANYYSRSDSFQLILFTPGLNEYGTDTSLLSVYGPLAYKNKQVWNGRIALNNSRGDSVECIIVSVQRFTSSYLPSPFLNTLYSNIINRYRIAKKSVHLTGLSLGGWAVQIAATYQPTSGDYSEIQKFKSVVNIQGVKPEDTYGSTPVYPGRFKFFAKRGGYGTGGRLLGFEQYVLDGRDINTVVTAMNDTAAGSAIYIGTAYGGGGHCCFEQFYGGTGYLPTKYSLDGRSQTIYEWMIRQGDTTLGFISGNTLPNANAGADRTIYLPTAMAVLYGTSSDPDGTVASRQWTKISGPASVDTIYKKDKDTAYAQRMIATGVYSYELAVTDNSGGVKRDTVNITIALNSAMPCNGAASVKYTVAPTAANEIYILNASGRGWKGGDTLLIPAGYYSVIEIDSFGGDPCRDIIIRNVGGQVVADVIRMGKDVHHVTVMGKDSAGIQYGIKTKTFGFGRVNHFTIKKLQFGPNTSSVGVYGKEIFDSTRYCTYYLNYTNVKITLDSNKVDSVDGEGFYIGDTAPDYDPYVGGIPQRCDSVTISNNTVSNTGWDGIQLSNSRNGCKIFGNTVTNFGLQDRDSQRAGIISGGNTNCDVYNNTVSNGTGNGIQFFGYGVLNCYGNTITNVGNTASHVDGEQSIYGSAYRNNVEVNPKQDMRIYNNQFNFPKVRGAVFFYDASPTNAEVSSVYNNRYCFITAPGTWPGSYIYVQQGYTGYSNILACGVVTSFGVRIKIKQ